VPSRSILALTATATCTTESSVAQVTSGCLAHRSAYFRLGGLLREHVPSRSVLALTATATRTTESSVAQALGVAPDCVFRDASLRDNLRLHVSHVNGGESLVLLLTDCAGVPTDDPCIV